MESYKIQLKYYHQFDRLRLIKTFPYRIACLWTYFHLYPTASACGNYGRKQDSIVATKIIWAVVILPRVKSKMLQHSRQNSEGKQVPLKATLKRSNEGVANEWPIEGRKTNQTPEASLTEAFPTNRHEFPPLSSRPHSIWTNTTRHSSGMLQKWETSRATVSLIPRQFKHRNPKIKKHLPIKRSEDQKSTVPIDSSIKPHKGIHYCTFKQ